MIYIKERRWFWTKRKSPFENNLYIKYIYIYSYKINKSNLISVKFLVFNDTSSIWCNVLGLPWRMQNRINGASIVRYFNRLYDVFSLICNCSEEEEKTRASLVALIFQIPFLFYSYSRPRVYYRRLRNVSSVVADSSFSSVSLYNYKSTYQRLLCTCRKYTIYLDTGIHPSIHPYFNTTFIRTDICIFMDDKLKTLLNRWVIVNLT